MCFERISQQRLLPYTTLANWFCITEVESVYSAVRTESSYRVRQKYLAILQNSCEWNSRREEFVLERSASETQSISVAMECWSVEHRAFAVETYFKNNDSVLTQRILRRHFNIHRNECPWSQYFFLWGYLKSKLYEKKPRTAVDFKQNIREEVASVSPNMLQRVMQNFQKRLGECVDNKGRHLTDTIFRKWML